MLDERKCSTTKNAIDHILTRLMNSFGVAHEKKNSRLSDLDKTHKNNQQLVDNADSDSSGSGGDKIDLDIMEEPYTSNDEIPNSDVEMKDEAEKRNTNQSDYVSSLRNPSFGGNQLDGTMQMNQSINQADVEMGGAGEEEVQFNKKLGHMTIDASGPKTRRQAKQQAKNKSFAKLGDDEAKNFWTDLHADYDHSDIL